MSSPSYIELHQSSNHNTGAESDATNEVRENPELRQNKAAISLPKLLTIFGLSLVLLTFICGLAIVHALFFRFNEPMHINEREFLHFPTVTNLAFGSCTAYDLRQVRIKGTNSFCYFEFMDSKFYARWIFGRMLLYLPNQMHGFGLEIWYTLILQTPIVSQGMIQRSVSFWFDALRNHILTFPHFSIIRRWKDSDIIILTMPYLC